MLVTGTPAAARIVERARRDRRGTLVFTIGTGCCESTAPFLYEDFWPGPDHEPVGEVDGVNEVKADQATKQVTISWDPDATDWVVIENTMKEINYPPVD